MIIAIIDDGVNMGYYADVTRLDFDMFVNRKCNVVNRTQNSVCENSHGTTCAAIIKKYAKNAQIGSIKIIPGDTHRGKIKHLISAIEWCTKNNIRLLHMSIGSTCIQDLKKLSVAIKKYQGIGGIIVSALTNTMKWSIPACLDGVIGVKTDQELTEEQYFAGGKGLYDVSFVASSQHGIKDFSGKQIITQCSNSYSAPLITAMVYKQLCGKPELTADELCNKLGGTSSRTISECIANTCLKEKEIDIPIISISGEWDGALSVAKLLEERFLECGYPCAVWSDKIIEDIYWLPHKNTKELLAFQSEMLSLSAILIVSDDSAWSDSYADCWIRIDGRYERNIYNDDTILVPENFYKNNINGIVRYLEKMNDK